MRAIPPRHASLFVIVALGLAASAKDAAAGEIQVEPTRLDLVNRGAATELTVTNRGSVATRFEAKVFAWAQDDQGTMQLAPTTDVVVYPTLFSLAPGGARAIRLATTTNASATERSYRVFVEELPPARAPVAEGGKVKIAVLTRVGVPIFVAATAPEFRGDVAATLHDGTVKLALANRGSVHVKVASVRVIGRDRDGATVVDQQQPSWYLLAGGTRTYTLDLTATCARIATLAVEAVTDHGTWQATVAKPPDGCHGGE